MTKNVSLTETFEGALQEILARFFISAKLPSAPSNARNNTENPDTCLAPAIAIAYSGGLDSSALLHLVHEYATYHPTRLFAFHVHHGISKNADSWLTHCQQECEERHIHFEARHINLSLNDKNGIEEAARIKRYAALGDLCREHHVPLLLTAHHQDDQAETVLLQLLRGSGVAGLSGMDIANTAPKLLNNASLIMARPLLSISRTELEYYVHTKKIGYVKDESNTDPRYARNALRHQVMPSLERLFPAFQQRFSRTAQHAQSAQRLLIELAAQDLAICLDGDCLNVITLQKLGADRASNLLRYWFGTRNLRMPSTAWLSELQTQLFEAKGDAQLCVTHPNCHLRRYRNRLFITPKFDEDTFGVTPYSFRWNGESQIHFSAFHGTLYFDEAETGADSEQLRSHLLEIRFRQGGERLKLASNRPTKSLKYHYQVFDVPPWERERLPLIFASNHLIFAAGIGFDCHHLSSTPGPKIQLRWQFSPLQSSIS